MRTAGPLLRFICSTIFLLLLAIPLDGQIRGTVTDSEGEPLSDVTVEIWSSEARLGATSTGPSGAFRFDVREARDAAGLSLRRLGYQPVVARASSGDTLLIFRMAEQPIALPQLTVSTARRVCPNREDADARRLWLTVRSRYATTTRLHGYAANVLWWRGETMSEDVGIMEESRLSPGVESWISEAVDIHDDIARNGYAFRLNPERGMHLFYRGHFFAWKYPLLEGRHAHHFLTDVFGSRHSLSMVSRDRDGYVVGFCPRDRKQPYIEGTLALAPDTTLHYATWAFSTPKPHEAAGGEVTFAPWSRHNGELPHLVAARGLFWRRMAGRKLYYQRSTVFLQWFLSRDDTEEGLFALPEPNP